MASQRSILTIAIDGASDVGLLGAITSLGAANSEGRLVDAALRWVGRDICTHGLLQREFTFYTASGQASYPLPSDYHLPVTDTTWNRSDQWFMRNIAQTEWQANKSGFTASQVHQRYRVMPAFGAAGVGVSDSDQHTQRRLHIDPTPDAAEKIVFNYRSGYWVQDSTTDTVESVTLTGTSEVRIVATSHTYSVGDVVAFYGVTGATELNGNIYTISATDTNNFDLMGTQSSDFVASGSADAVEGITLSGSNPVQIDATAHGRSNGDQVIFSSVGGTTELNGNSYLIESVTADTFDLTGTDSTNFTAYTTGGTFIPWTPAGTFIEITNTPGSGLLTFPLFPDELLEMGLAYRLRQRMGMSYFEHKAEYEDRRDAYKGALHGDHRINLGSGRMLGNWPGIPEGNYPSS